MSAANESPRSGLGESVEMRIRVPKWLERPIAEIVESVAALEVVGDVSPPIEMAIVSVAYSCGVPYAPGLIISRGGGDLVELAQMHAAARGAPLAAIEELVSKIVSQLRAGGKEKGEIVVLIANLAEITSRQEMIGYQRAKSPSDRESSAAAIAASSVDARKGVGQ